MEFIKFVEQIPNITIAKRIASAYVADYRRLELEEIKEFFNYVENNKTPLYTFEDDKTVLDWIDKMEEI